MYCLLDTPYKSVKELKLLIVLILNSDHGIVCIFIQLCVSIKWIMILVSFDKF